MVLWIIHYSLIENKELLQYQIYDIHIMHMIKKIESHDPAM